MKYLNLFVALLAFSVFSFAAEAPTGAPVAPTSDEAAALASLKGKLAGKIVWSSSRSHSTHDLWLMNADGSDPKQLTNSQNVDWFPRFSPDGKSVIFTRSKGGWTPENDANYPEKWDLWMVDVNGENERKVVENATWGTFRPDGKSIVFSRGANVYQKNLESGEETLVLDGKKAFGEDGVILQEPNMSPDGKYLAITLRGSMRETGVYDLQNKKWNKSGDGCQIDFSADGKWLVWGATAKGHDHDIYDYELYLWEIGTPAKTAARLTFHTANDRWPDIWLEK